MRAQYCSVCKKDFRCEYFHTSGGGAFVGFRDYRPTPDGSVGPAEGLAWFCQAHLAAGRSLAHLTVDEALAELKRVYGEFPDPPPSLMPDSSLWITSIGPNYARVFAVVREAMGITPSKAKALLDGAAFKVAGGWPSQFEHWKEALCQAGATVEVRYE
jgi:hypothetical protein